ncbi:HAD hydrolase-like protein [Lachnobacterium bovis]|uniref:ATP-grasp domain-containing protein n=1 Tax=Lachnobacterium bovis TaxID=140626 RepID=A0A1H9PFR1_9FIRM|nr:HAD hydrolase-like protein [Lachnobacterium bovis]SER46987.1 ATP-grasp domain-containing protein [Lachnobacterium bovis]
MNILFTSVGRRVEIIRSYKEAASNIGIPVTLIGTDITNSSPALSFCDKSFLTSKVEDEGYIEEVIDICISNDVQLLIPLREDGIYIFSDNREKFSAIGVKLFLSSREMIEICKDKTKTALFFATCKLRYPNIVENAEKYKGEFPCFIKQRNREKDNIGYKVETKAELLAFAQDMEDYIIRPFIDGIEYSVDVFCDFDGNPIYITPRERISVREKEVVKSRIVQDEKIITESKIIINKFKPVGPISIHLIRKEGTKEDYFIKIIPGYSSGVPHSIKAGADSSTAAILMLLGKKLLYKPFAARDRIGYSRYEDSVCTYGNGIYHIDKLEMIFEHSKGIKVVIFDLDNTLYREIDYIKSGCAAVAQQATTIFKEAVYSQVYDELVSDTLSKKPAIRNLVKKFASGLPQKRQFDLTQLFLNTYRNHDPKIGITQETIEVIETLKKHGISIGIVTDGRSEVQRKKLAKLGLMNDSRISEILLTDELAGKNGNPSIFRKPNPLPFEILKLRFGVPYHCMIFVGANMQKDFEAPQRLGMRCLHFNNSKGNILSKNAIDAILSIKI